MKKHKDCKSGGFFRAITARKVHNKIILRKHITFKHKTNKSGIGFLSVQLPTEKKNINKFYEPYYTY